MGHLLPYSQCNDLHGPWHCILGSNYLRPPWRPIYYPPLFHMLLLLIVKITGISLFTVSRFIQPVMAFMIILSFSYVAERLYGGLTGFLTGVFSISSLFFLRMLYPIPESLAVRSEEHTS